MVLLVLSAVLAVVTAHPSTASGPYLEPVRKSTSKELSVNNSQLEDESNQWCQHNNVDIPYDSFVQYLWYELWKKMGSLDLNKIKLIQNGSTMMKVYIVDKILVMANFGFKEDIIRICRIVWKAKRELESISDDEETFMSPLRRNDISETIAIITLAYEYACYHYGQNILDFLDNGGFQCLKVKENELLSCLRVSIDSNLFNLQEPKDEDDVRKNRGRECQILNDLEACVLEKTDSCTNFDSRLFIEEVLISVIAPSCRKIR